MLYYRRDWPTHVRARARIDVTRYVKLVEICEGIVMIISHWAVTSNHHLPLTPPLPVPSASHISTRLTHLLHTALYTWHIARERDISQYTSYKFSRISKSFFTMKIEFSISKRHIVHWIAELFLSDGEVKFHFWLDERVYGDARSARSNMQIRVTQYPAHADHRTSILERPGRSWKILRQKIG